MSVPADGGGDGDVTVAVAVPEDESEEQEPVLVGPAELAEPAELGAEVVLVAVELQPLQ